MRHVLTVLAVAFTSLFAATSAPPSADSLLPFYRTYVFGKKPTMDPAAVVTLVDKEIPGLWAAMKLQIFRVQVTMPDGRKFDTESVICFEDKFYPLEPNNPTFRLLSTTVAGDALYYTYSAGSGIYRSHVARITIEQGVPVIQRSQGYFSQGLPLRDLFVQRQPDGRVAVHVGQRSTDGQAAQLRLYGIVDSSDRTQIRFLGGAAPIGQSSDPLSLPQPARP